MSEFELYRLWEEYLKRTVTDIRAYIPGENLEGKVGVSDEAKLEGSPKAGDMIARDPNNHDDQWLITKEYFEENYELECPDADGAITSL